MASSNAQNAQQQAIIPGDPQAQLKLEVLAGVHRGAALTLDKAADYRIGCSPQADIVLRDPGVAAEHAVLRIESAAVRIDAIGGEVGIEHKSIPSGHGCRVRLPVEFALGEARLRLSRPGADRDARHLLLKARRSLADKPTAIAVGAICLAVVITAVAVGGPRAVQMNGAQAKSDTINPDGSGATSKASTTVQQAMQGLDARLRAAKIHTLQVKAVDGRLVVAGKLIKQQVADWAAIRQWFDQTYGGGIVLTANVTDDDGPAAMPTLQLQAIWYGDRPYIITAHGERYYQGAVLDNGWIVRQIGEHHVLLAKAGDTVVLSY
jgi:hypothetical protein